MFLFKHLLFSFRHPQAKIYQRVERAFPRPRDEAVVNKGTSWCTPSFSQRSVSGNSRRTQTNAPDESRVHPEGCCRVSSRKGFSDFVPEGLNDGSQAIYCLVSVQKREPPRRARYDWVRQACDDQDDNQPWVRIKPCPTGRILD